MFHFCLPVVEWTVEVLSFLLDQDFLTWIPGTRYQSAELYVLQSGIFYPIRHGANDSRIACGEGSFQQDANIRRLFCTCQFSCASSSAACGVFNRCKVKRA